MREQMRARAQLDDAAEVHHRDPRGDAADRGEVVRDEEQGEAALATEPVQQVEQHRAHRRIDRGDRLIADEQVGARGERARDGSALALTRREFARIRRGGARGKSHLIQQCECADPRLVPARDAVHLHPLGDRIDDRHLRRERGAGVLGYELDAPAHAPQRLAA